MPVVMQADTPDSLRPAIPLSSPGLRPAFPPSPAPPAPLAAPPLTPEQFHQWMTAQAVYQPIRRAMKVATFDAWCTAVFAGLTLLCGFSTPAALLLGLGMAGVTFVSFRGLSRLRTLDPTAARTLALNQLALATIITLYCLWNLYAQLTGRASPFDSAIYQDPALKEMLGSVEGLARQLAIITYSAVIGATMLAQGLTAWFYARRTRMIRAFLGGTPEWVVRLLNATPH
jgi:hypothetical protein